MTPPRWLRGGATSTTVVATVFSFLAIPIGGLGLLALLFGAWVPGIVFAVSGVVLWVTGRRLLDL